MVFKNKLIIGAVTTLMAVSVANASALANREICKPQDANMAESGIFVSVCDWNLWRSGADTNALITLNGKMRVHAECEFSGSDKIMMITPSKHSAFKPLIEPGNYFNFDIGYHELTDSTDDNQNILIYLNKRNPSPDNYLVCTFTTMS